MFLNLDNLPVGLETAINS